MLMNSITIAFVFNCLKRNKKGVCVLKKKSKIFNKPPKKARIYNNNKTRREEKYVRNENH